MPRPTSAALAPTLSRPPEVLDGPPRPSAVGAGPFASWTGERRPRLPGIPLTPAGTISRPALDAVLEQAPDMPLTVVCAGPGWGKTTAVAQWLATSPSMRLPAAWLTVQPGTNDVTTFWESVIGALRRSGAVPADHPLAVLSGAAGISEEVMTSLLHGLDSLPCDVLLVLDDVHELSDPQVLDSLSSMIERTTRVRLVVLSRVVPELPCHRLRLAGTLVELTADDLAFDTTEIGALAAAHGLDVSQTQAVDLLAKTEGWPVGVRLALLHASRHDARSLVEFAGSERSVAEYLLAEVLERNSPQVRDFLLRTSVAERVCAELAGSIVPGVPAQSVLEALESRGEFVTALGPDRTWFRYHPLLRDLLRHSLRRDDPDALRVAHQRTARWWATHDDPVQALRHASAAEDWPLFSQIYSRAAGPSLVGPGREALRACLQGVPFDSLPEGIGPHLQQAGLALLEGRGGSVTMHCVRARMLARHDDTVSPAARVLLELLTLGGHRLAGEATAVLEGGQRAGAILDSADPFPAQPGYRLIATHNLGVGRFWSGDVDAASRDFTAVIDNGGSDAAGADLTQLGAKSYLALATLVQGDLAQAEATATNALAYAGSRGWSSTVHACPAHLASAVLHLLHGDWDLAEPAVASGLAAVRGGTEPPSTLWLHCIQVEVAASRGRAKAAQLASHTAQLSAQAFAMPAFLTDVVDHALTEAALLTGHPRAPWPGRPPPRTRTAVQASCEARLLLARGDHVGARQLAADVPARGRAENVTDLVAHVEALIVMAMSEDLDWRPESALAALRRAVELAAAQRIARPFLVTRSVRMAALLQGLGGPDGDPFAQELLARLSRQGQVGAEPEPLRHVLTDRELAVLAALPTMKSNSQIAEDFYVSVNTVKSHLKGLYRKLDVSSRRDAVERARTLGLLR
ncbi:MAG: LuxR C-terminal-related transcriptional regulator [Dermatophilaceae bacterium]